MTRARSVWWWLIPCAAAGLWVDLGTIHRLQHADSIVNILCSLQAWTFFYWDQDRYGMLVPLLSVPIRHPLGNLLVQCWVTITAGLFAPILIARYAIQDAVGPLIGAATAAAFLATSTAAFRFEWLVDHPYGVFLSLGLAGLLVATPGPTGFSWGRIALGVVLVILAHWVNVGTVIALAPLMMIRALGSLRPSSSRGARAWTREDVRTLLRSRTYIEATLIAIGFAAGRWAMTWAPVALTDFAASPIERWPVGWSALARNLAIALGPSACAGLVAGCSAGPIAWSIPRLRSGAIVMLPGAGTLAGVASASWIYLGTRRWTEINDDSFRYLIPAALMLGVAAMSLAVGPIVRAIGPRGERWTGWATAVLLVGAAGWSYGLPSIRAVRADLDRRCGMYTADLIAARCTHLAGDYWTVWPCVFHANMALHDRGEARALYGITFRSGPTRRLWRDEPPERFRIGVPRGDGRAAGWMQSYLLVRPAEVERRRTLSVLRPAPRGSRPPDP